MSNASILELEMLALINAERAEAGLDAVVLNTTLNAAAEDHSQWMLEDDTFSHTGEGGSSAGDRMATAGFPFEAPSLWAENIGWQSARGEPGYSDDVAMVHEGLMNSPGHRANILNPSIEEIGIGVEIGEFTAGANDYEAVMITQNFATTAGDTSSMVDPGTGVADPQDPPAEEVPTDEAPDTPQDPEDPDDDMPPVDDGPMEDDGPTDDEDDVPLAEDTPPDPEDETPPMEDGPMEDDEDEDEEDDDEPDTPGGTPVAQDTPAPQDDTPPIEDDPQEEDPELAEAPVCDLWFDFADTFDFGDIDGFILIPVNLDAMWENVMNVFDMDCAPDMDVEGTEVADTDMSTMNDMFLFDCA